MAFALAGDVGGFTRTVASGVQPTIATTRAIDAGEFLVLTAASDNLDTGDGLTFDQFVSSVTDSTNNVWCKGESYCNGRGANNAGAVITVWYCNVAYPLANGTTITINVS